MAAQANGNTPMMRAVDKTSSDDQDVVISLGDKFYNSMEMHKDRIHHVDASTGVTETKNSVKSRAIKLATVMRQRGIKEGNVIIIASKTHAEQTVVLLACFFCGVTVAPIHTEQVYDDLKRIVKILQPKLAFCGTKSSRVLNRVFNEVNIRCPIFSFHDEQKEFTNVMRCFDIKEDKKFVVSPIKDPKRMPCFIITTLGTECPPKLVSVSHHALFTRYSRFLTKFDKPDKVISFFPLSCTMHILVSCICFDTEMKLVYLRHYSERSICKYIHELKIEHMFLDGELAIRIVKNVSTSDFDLTCLKTVYVGGMPLSTTNFARVVKVFRGVNVNTTYQTIETGMVTIVTENVFSINRDKVLSAGLIYSGINVRVVDPVNGQVVGYDKYGELHIKTPALMLGYYKDPAATNKVFSKGYFKTGDLGSIDCDGYIYIKGRISDHISRDGHIFAAADIEEIVKLNPDVAEVVCFPDETDLIVCVVKKEGHEISAPVLLEFISDVLPSYKIPTKVYFRDNFPKTLLGVIKKYVVKQDVVKVVRNNSLYQGEQISRLGSNLDI